MRKILYILITVVCVWVLNNNTYAQIRVINNKGTFFQVDTSKWVLSGLDIYNKNTVGNVGIGIFPNNARFVVSNGGSAILPAFKLKYPFSGALSDSILTWNPSDSTVRKINLNSYLNIPANGMSVGAPPPAILNEPGFFYDPANHIYYYRDRNGNLAWLWLYTAQNGLSTDGVNKFELGGSLSKNTTINQNTFSLNFTGTGNIGMGTASPSNRLHIDAVNPLRLVGLQTNTTDNNILVATSTGVIQQRTIASILNGNAVRSLNGLTNSTQTFATGTTGTDFNIVSSGTTHTFHFPNASSANRGLLTSTDWNLFNNKIGTVTATTPAAVTTVGTTATINNTGAYWNANQLQGRNISTTAPTNGQFLTWNNTTSLWEPSNTTNDAKDHHVTRSDATTNVAPSSLEIPSPIAGHTAKVHLTNGRVEYWSYNGTIWVLDWTQVPPEDGVDIGYIVAWGSNATPPDYLLPLTGGTYNWVDFPHLQSLQSTHPSQFIASSNATTFTLVNINTSGRFLRGGLTAGVNQNGSTAMPINPFVLSNYSHNHNYTNTTSNFITEIVSHPSDAPRTFATSETNNNLSSSDNTHTHTISSGGDTETRPINTSVIWCLKAKPTMTAGNITINTGSVTISSVSNSIVGNQLTTTVNGVSSTPVTLPTPEPSVVEIYDASGTQALSTTFANLTFGTTNIADAGYTVGGSGSQITITTAGTYRITYRVTVRLTNNSSSGGEFIMTRNGTEVPGTRGYTYNHNNNRIHGTVTVVKLLTVSAGDVIRVQGRRYSAAGDLSLTANGSSLIIERIK